MTEQEVIARQEQAGNREFYMIHVGPSFHAYGSGAYALARVTGYRVVRKRRKAGNVLMASFPVGQLEQVRVCITTGGGEMERIDEKTYRFWGIDGSPEDRLINGPHFTRPSVKPEPQIVLTEKDRIMWLKDAVLNFNLSMSTPIDAMLFLGTLQQRLKEE